MYKFQRAATEENMMNKPYPDSCKFKLGEYIWYSGKQVQVAGYSTERKEYLLNGAGSLSGAIIDFEAAFDILGRINPETNQVIVHEDLLFFASPKFKLGDVVLYGADKTPRAILAYNPKIKSYYLSDSDSPIPLKTYKSLAKLRTLDNIDENIECFEALESNIKACEYPIDAKFKLGESVYVRVNDKCILTKIIGYSPSQKWYYIKYDETIRTLEEDIKHCVFRLPEFDKSGYVVHAENSQSIFKENYFTNKLGKYVFVNGTKKKVLGILKSGALLLEESSTDSNYYLQQYIDNDKLITHLQDINPLTHCAVYYSNQYKEQQFGIGDYILFERKKYEIIGVDGEEYTILNSTHKIKIPSDKAEPYSYNGKFHLGSIVYRDNIEFTVIGFNEITKIYIMDSPSCMRDFYWDLNKTPTHTLPTFDFSRACTYAHENDLTTEKTINSHELINTIYEQTVNRTKYKIASSVYDTDDNEHIVVGFDKNGYILDSGIIVAEQHLSPTKNNKYLQIETDIADACYRVAAKQLIDLIKGIILTQCSSGVKELLETDVIRSTIGLVVGHTLSNLDDVRAQRLAKEFRVAGMMVLEEAVVDYILDMISKDDTIQEKIILTIEEQGSAKS